MKSYFKANYSVYFITINILVTLSLSTLKNLNYNKKSTSKTERNLDRTDILGNTDNKGKELKSAITYGLGDVTAYNIPKEDEFKYISPIFIDKLPKKFSISD